MSDRIFGHGYDIKKEYTIGLATSPTSFSSLQQNSNPVISQAAVGLPNGDHNMMDESPSQPHSNEQRQMFSYGNPSPFLGSPQPNLHSPSQPSADQISDVLVSLSSFWYTVRIIIGLQAMQPSLILVYISHVTSLCRSWTAFPWSIYTRIQYYAMFLTKNFNPNFMISHFHTFIYMY